MKQKQIKNFFVLNRLDLLLTGLVLFASCLFLDLASQVGDFNARHKANLATAVEVSGGLSALFAASSSVGILLDEG